MEQNSKYNKIYWSGKNSNFLINGHPMGSPLGKIHEAALNLLRQYGWKRVSVKTTDVPVFAFTTRKAADFPAKGPNLPQIRLFPQKNILALDDKKILWFTMVQSGSGNHMPFTFHSIDDFLSFQNNSVTSIEEFNAVKENKKKISGEYSKYSTDERFLRHWRELFEIFLYDLGDPKVWFLKHVNGVRGNAVNAYYGTTDVCSAVQKIESNSRDDFIIQQEVKSVLINRRKIVIRSHVVLLLSPKYRNELKAFIYKESIVVLHSEPYNMLSTSKAVHVSQIGHSAPKPYLLKKLKPEILEHEKIQNQITTITKKAILATKEHLVPANFDKTATLYHLFGLDFMVDKMGKVVLIEANAYPAIASGSMASVETSIYTELISDLISLVVLPVTNNADISFGNFYDLNI